MGKASNNKTVKLSVYIREKVYAVGSRVLDQQKSNNGVTFQIKYEFCEVQP